ncbi:[FeFe] hydrogenase H-cluster radical SAM maturase HydG [Clostridioides difficile]|uniref:[FeFe] hydrogenase H-cluster radical SAM maturase HydG n=1 Tax=Clostridioides difficile TaxID=1496 RepID=UPI000D1E7C07|nr:[FeFe] hydrogenase H-cluster radical SAM maturase HydG [Clostridioides difficile]EJX2680912.1 [FeFe] hydrogenase H-cluster radical SAM maturase HydG [Clostridioides difficile]MBZ1157943.1 [FeFe] hydrogenase H-cluster radical SAM maturase HydG [Clostridioides difficile]MCV2286226.1 [FeFe] hydrogenase H-cluster radical SAM maturase HydG [Clostridioides difficile]MCW0697261.1 [FeFe] hydrogenase H-cluster radical SAM maturase HydG [Clostridioides difficile]MDC9631854.1 [FeFe] hydrogenase H-clus
MFINHELINSLLEDAKNSTSDDIEKVLDKADRREKLSYKDIATLLEVEDKKQLDRLFSIAGQIKNEIYGNRVVLFAPLYVSNYCVNECVYCGFSKCNKFKRKKLTMEEIKEEVKILEKMGHKRLALEAGEDPKNCDINYILDCLDAIYSTYNENGNIRRVNVNIAATSVNEYKLLKEKGIGTYILFQETYHKPTFIKMHGQSIKNDYYYHLTAFDRAMEAGVDDVGAGVLFGLSDPKFEVLGLMMHNEHLEEKFGVGFHTISFPRLKKAEGMSLEDFPHLVSDDMFKKIVAITRLAVPFTGIIMSTRETAEMRNELLKYGVSQISAGSLTGVGGYKAYEDGDNTEQFEVGDHRSPVEVLKELITDGYIPSYCTACYRKGRTGDRFMSLAKSRQIHNVCTPNALTTLNEFLIDYGDEELKIMGKKLIAEEIGKIEREDIRNIVSNNMTALERGERDLYL